MMNPITIRLAAERIRRAINQYLKNQIGQTAALEIVESELTKLDPILNPFTKIGVRLPQPIRRLVQSIHESGLTVPMIEKMYPGIVVKVQPRSSERKEKPVQ